MPKDSWKNYNIKEKGQRKPKKQFSRGNCLRCKNGFESYQKFKT